MQRFAALLFPLLLLLLLPALARAVDSDALLAAVRDSGLPAGSLSLLALESGKDRRVVLDFNSREALVPASVTKLVTAAAALRHIPLNTRFETRLLSVAPRQGATLAGDLVLQGGGDPSLVSETLWLLVNRLAQTGVREITGNLVVDDSYFDAIGIDPSRDTERSEMAYDAPVSATSFNWNAVAVTLAPGTRVGEPALVLVEPESDYIEVRNSVRTVAGDSIAGLVLGRKPKPDGSGDILTARGTIGINANPYQSYRNISFPALWTGANLKRYLRYRGIDVRGAVVRGPTPDGARVLATIEGRPLEQLVADMNKVSSNFIAEMLAKNLAARHHPPGTLKAGMAVMADYMAGLGVSPGESRLANPSGLTRRNRLSAHALVQVLADMAGDFRISHEFQSSLPIAGIDGTLEKRMADSPARGWIRAKTGYIEGAVSLAGYAGRNGGNDILFAFIYNGPAPAYEVRALFDRLCAQMVAP